MGMIYSPGVAGLTGQVQFNDSGILGADNGLFWNNTNKRLGINNSSPSSQLDISSSLASQVPLTIRGATSQSANLQEWQSNGRTTLIGLNANFKLNGYTSVNGGTFGATVPLGINADAAGSCFIMAYSDTDYTLFQSGGIQKGFLAFGSTPFVISAAGEIRFTAGSAGCLFNGAGNNVPVVIRGSSGQTSNICEWRNNTNVVRASVTKDFELQTTTGSGAPTTTPADGATYVDTTNHRFYVRSGGAWKYTNLI